MNISETFIRRPVATTLLMAALIIFGVMGFSRLALNDMPNIEFPFIIVMANMSGADPETMATSVAKPLEKQLSTISGIKTMTSTSRQGSAVVFLEFDYGRDIDKAALDVQSAISQAYARMPDAMTTAPLFVKVNPDSMPVLQLALTSATLTAQQLTEYAETYIAQRLTMITGVAQANVRGAKRYAVRILVDPDLMAARNVSMEEITAVVGQANVSLPTGVLQGETRIRNIRASGEITTAEEFGNIIVAWRNGAPIRLSDVASVEDSIESTTQQTWLDGKTGVVIQVVRTPGGNTVETVSNIMQILPELIESLPPSVELKVFQDNSIVIKDSVEEVEFTLVLTIILVVLIIFLFLRDAMATMIPSLALPVSILGTFALMFAFNFSLNNVSLMALILVVGFVVDDAIVMLENIIRHREMGKSPLQAALDGSREVGFTILSMTLSLASVFIPLLFLPGMVGKMFLQFGAVIVIAVSMSFIVSISLTPMMCANFLPEHSLHKKNTGITAAFNRFFHWLTLKYESSLHIAMRHKFIVFLASVGLIILTGFFAGRMPTGFFPNMDGGLISISTKAEESISFAALSKAQQQMHDIISADPAVESYVSTVGGGMRGETNTGSFTVILKPHAERDHIDVVIARLREALSNNPVLEAYVSNAHAQGGPGGSSNSYQLVGSNSDELYATAYEVRDALAARSDVFRDVTTDLQLQNPVIYLDVDRDKATTMGVTLMQIENALYSAFGTRQVSIIYTSASDYKVLLQVDPTLQYSSDVISTLYLRANDGRFIPLDTIVTMRQEAGPLTVSHAGQFPAVTLSFNFQQGISMGEGMAVATQIVDEMLPETVTGKFIGMAQEFQSSMVNMLLLIVAAIVLIYIVLGILYESFIHPITILSGLPSAAFGAIFFLWLFGQELNMMGMVGIIMLIGIVKKNAIMMLDFALTAERTEHLSPDQAIVQGCLVRFRPIMMTTLAAIMGALPLAIGMGVTGADLRRPIGICVSGGLIFSQIVTLYITPVYYVYLDRFGTWVKERMRILFRLTITAE